jgi:tetratricopeptide (TPR) repeat protein
MKTETLSASIRVCLLVATLGLNPGCSQKETATAHAPLSTTPAATPLALLLVPHVGTGKLDDQIRQSQAQLRVGPITDAALERLGWLFVAKARESFDPGFYKLAEQTAAAIEADHFGSSEALMLRGHVFENLHRFHEAEAIAQDLASRRGLPADFGLLGDALMEQGKLSASVEAYQQMADLKPDLHAWVRAAHVRWLKGDLAGATDLMSRAVQAVSPRDADTTAWTLSRLGAYRFQAGDLAQANHDCAEALAAQPDYPPALLLEGRILLARDQVAEAVPLLRQAARLVPLPEYQWALAEALAGTDQTSAAQSVEAELCRTGAQADPRTFALFLATRRQNTELALSLTRSELDARQDVFTHDALAWALSAEGKINEAEAQTRLALREGTADARLFFHAAVIADQAGDSEQAAAWTRKALSLQHLLLPSERHQLLRLPVATQVGV